jgi:hypothetical protein
MLTSQALWQAHRYKEHSFPLRLSHLELPTPLDRGGISGDLTDFSSTNGAFSSFKGTEEGYKSDVNLTRHCDSSSVTTNTDFHRVYLCWKHPRRWIELKFRVT